MNMDEKKGKRVIELQVDELVDLHCEEK